MEADRQPILLMADCQTTGGYATLTTKIADDNSLEAQLRLGNSLPFVARTWARPRTFWGSTFAQLNRLLPLAASDVTAFL